MKRECVIEWMKRLEKRIRKSKRVDAIRYLEKQNVNAEEAIIGQLQERNMFLI